MLAFLCWQCTWLQSRLLACGMSRPHIPCHACQHPACPWPRPLPAAFEGVEPAHLQIRCLRKRALRDAQMRAVAWYSLYCTEDADVPMVQEILETPEYQALVAPHTHQELNRALYIPAGSRMIPDPPPRDGIAGEPEFRKRYNPPSEERDARLDAALDAAVAAQQAEAAAAAVASAAQAAAAQQAGAAQQGPAATEHTLQQ